MLGYDLPTYLPILFFLLIILFMFDCFKRTLKVFGFRFYEFKEDHECDQIESGRRLINENKDRIYEELLIKNKKLVPTAGKIFLSSSETKEATEHLAHGKQSTTRRADPDEAEK